MNSIAGLSRYLIPAAWAIWIVGWLAAAWNVKPTQWREPQAKAIYNRLPVLIGTIMMMAPQRLPAVLTRRFLPAGLALPALGTILVFAGLLFAGWARWHLGRNWSGIVTVKQGHSLIQTGPYRLVRHPIYSGLLLAVLGTALAIGAPYGFIATGLILIGFVIKLQVEETRMRETFPEYRQYRRETAALIPWVY